MEYSPENNRLVALVSNSTWSVYNFRIDIIRMLRNDGFEVLVIAPPDEYAPRLIEAGCRFEPIQFNNRTLNPFNDVALFWSLRRIYQRFRPVFIFHYVAKPNIYGSIAARSCGVPSAAVITGLGYAFHKRNLLNWLIRKMYRFALSRSTETWFLNKEDARVFLSEKLVDVQKVKVLPGEGINTRHFALSTGSAHKVFTFVMSTRLLKSKGVGVFADASRILRKRNFDFRCRLIGFFEAHHPDSVSQTELDKWQKEGLLQYDGFADDVRPVLQEGDCFVFPSYYNEGIPRCLMEASSMGLPVITSFNRGCKETVVNNVTGFLCHVNDPFDLADKMEKMLLLPDVDRQKMGMEGRRLMEEKFSVASIYQEYAATLNSLKAD